MDKNRKNQCLTIVLATCPPWVLLALGHTAKNVAPPVRTLACFNSQRNLRESTNDSLQNGEAPRGQANHNTFTDKNLPLKQH